MGREQGAGSKEQRTESYNELQIDAWKVIEELVDREPEGATVETLASVLNLHQGKIRRILSTWEVLGLVRNKGGWYYLTEKLTHTLPGHIARNHMMAISKLQSPIDQKLAFLREKMPNDRTVGEEVMECVGEMMGFGGEEKNTKQG